MKAIVKCSKCKNAFNSKVYKLIKFNNNNMLPGDLSRSPDESFFSFTKLMWRFLYV